MIQKAVSASVSKIAKYLEICFQTDLKMINKFLIGASVLLVLILPACGEAAHLN